MDSARLPQIVLAKALVGEITTANEHERRQLLCRFSDILRPVCKGAEEAFGLGFDAGAQWQANQKGQK